LKLKIKFHDGTFLFSFDQIKKFSFSREKNQLLNVYFLTLFYYFFSCGWVFYFFFDREHRKRSSKRLFFFYECCVFWAGGAGVKIRQKSCFLCRGFLL